MIKLSDYVFQSLADRGVRHVFVVTGGGAMHLNDSLGKENRIQYICNHHEQASAIAAEAYARVAGTPGVVSVTSGPGGINALNGVFGAWTDSIPMLVISGQVKRETLMATHGIEGLRQLGDQEADIVRMVKGITKYAALVLDPSTIRYHLERAFHLANAGRPGPCWIDIPVDVQSSRIEPGDLAGYDPAEDDMRWDPDQVRRQCDEVLERIRRAARPVIIAGSGVRLAGAVPEFQAMAGALGIPVTTAWTHDIIASDDPLFCGRPGTIGERAGNFTVQNSDLVLVLGSRLNIRQSSYNWPSFARRAFKVQVDVDPAELRKPTVCPDLAINCDLRIFFTEFLKVVKETDYSAGTHCSWLAWCKERVEKYPVVRESQRRESDGINPYYFIERLFGELRGDDVVVCGDATACIVPFQAARLKSGQRMFSNSGCASMGYDLPAAIGAAVAHHGERVICLAGDGSIQLNIQELQTIAHHRWPIKIFVLENGGYLSIRTTQANFFGRLIGEGPTSGVSFPDFAKLAAAYGLAWRRIETTRDLPGIADVLRQEGPVVCSVKLDQSQPFEPRLKSRELEDGTIVTPALEDMFPFLDPEELRANSIGLQ